jgi:hypothetical protein
VLRQRAAEGSSPAAPGRECIHAVERIEEGADARRIAMERIDFDHLAANGTPGTLDAPEPAARAYVGALECHRARRWQILRRVSRGSRAHPVPVVDFRVESRRCTMRGKRWRCVSRTPRLDKSKN